MLYSEANDSVFPLGLIAEDGARYLDRARDCEWLLDRN